MNQDDIPTQTSLNPSPWLQAQQPRQQQSFQNLNLQEQSNNSSLPQISQQEISILNNKFEPYRSRSIDNNVETRVLQKPHNKEKQNILKPQVLKLLDLNGRQEKNQNHDSWKKYMTPQTPMKFLKKKFNQIGSEYKEDKSPNNSINHYNSNTNTPKRKNNLQDNNYFTEQCQQSNFVEKFQQNKLQRSLSNQSL